METKIFRADLDQAAELIKNGELVAVPTETVYGLAGNGLDERAVEKIYELKGRPAVKPLSLMVSGPQAMDSYCVDIPPQARRLAERFWPGPLTIVLKSRETVPELVRAGGETVGLRCPDHPATLKLLELVGLPLAAPSANPSGEESPKTAEKVAEYFQAKLPGIIDGGPCSLGRESSLIDMSSAPYKLLRQGALSRERIEEALVEGLLLVGITGGTGCGKTTALLELEKLGALVIDCDQVYHSLLQTSAELIAELDSRFPGVVIDGQLDRKALGAIVFSDAAALKELNRISHRHVGEAVQARLRDWAMKGGRIAAIDAIELIGSGLGRRCAFTLAVTAPEELRAVRIMARDGISREYALMRIRAQRPDSYFEENCDYVLKNDSDKAAFVNKFNKLIKEELEKWTN